jgi:DNA invertase Pin-like site-specific DNA recombinase
MTDQPASSKPLRPSEPPSAVERPRPKAYSYLRFSTPDQMDGDSFRRQWDAAKDYAERERLDLDQELTFHDLGVRSFRGDNVERGKLAAFRRAVEDGVVTSGSYLLVEDFDRLSRMDPWDAFPIFQEIINNDINLVTLKDGKVWNKQEIRGNPLRLMEPLFAMWNSHNESAKKSVRLSEAHAAKRRRLTDGGTVDKPYKHGPGWLHWDAATKRFVIIPERGTLVQDIFSKADNGWSLDRIARWLNGSGVPPWERGKRRAAFWRGSRLRKMLLNRAAIGVLAMHKSEHDPDTRRRSDKPVGALENYYPPVVERDVFERVVARLGTTAPRGRNAARAVTSLVAGVAKCAHCGASFIRVSKGQYVYVVCSRAHAKAGCKYQAVHYRDVEGALRTNIDTLIEDAPRGSSTEHLEEQITALDWQVSDMIDEAQALFREFRRTRSPTMGQAMREAEREIEAAKSKLQQLRERRDRLSAAFVLRRLNRLRDELKRGEQLDVTAANGALKAAVERIVVNPETASVAIHWRDSDGISEVPFWSRHYRGFDEPTDDDKTSTDAD